MRALKSIGALLAVSSLAGCLDSPDRPSASACWLDEVKVKLSAQLKPALANALIVEYSRQAPGAPLPPVDQVIPLLTIKGAEFSAVGPDKQTLAMVCSVSLDVALRRPNGAIVQSSGNDLTFMVYPGERGPTPEIVSSALVATVQRFGPLTR